jgi:hypothetical protein
MAARRRHPLTDQEPGAGYTSLQASRLTGCAESQLQYWECCGLVVPARVPIPDSAGRASSPSARGARTEPRYSFRDLVTLRMVYALLDGGLPLVRVRRAVEELLRCGDDIAGVRIVTDGHQVWACHDDGQIQDALGRGRLVLFIAVDRIAADVEAVTSTFLADRQRFVDELRLRDHPAGSA